MHVVQGGLQLGFDVDPLHGRMVPEDLVGPAHVDVPLSHGGAHQLESPALEFDAVVPEVVGEGPGAQAFDGGHGVFGDVKAVDGIDAGTDHRAVHPVQQPDDLFRKAVTMVFHGQPDAVVGGERCRLRQKAGHSLQLRHDLGMEAAGGKRPGTADVHAHLDDISPKVPGGGDGSFQIMLDPDAEFAAIHGKIVLQIEPGFPGCRSHLLQVCRLQILQYPIVQVHAFQVQIHDQVKQLEGGQLAGPGAGETHPGLADAVHVQAVSVKAKFHGWDSSGDS